MRFLGLSSDGIGPKVDATAETVLAEINQKFELNIKLEHDTVDFKSVDKHGVTIRPKMLGMERLISILTSCAKQLRAFTQILTSSKVGAR